MVADSDGDAFTSISHGRSCESMMISYPYSSNECLSLTMTYARQQAPTQTNSQNQPNTTSVLILLQFQTMNWPASVLRESLNYLLASLKRINYDAIYLIKKCVGSGVAFDSLKVQA